MTDEGTPAAVVLELDSDTDTPPLPATAVRLTVPVPVWPLMRVVGLTATLLSVGVGGFTLIVTVALRPE
jgi:hypothetical protein